MSEDGLSRRDLLKKAGLGGAVFLGGSLVIVFKNPKRTHQG